MSGEWLDGCSAIAACVYRDALLPLADPVDGGVLGLRRELFRHVVAQVGVVDIRGARRRLQFAEVDGCLDELEFAGLIENSSDGEVVHIRVAEVV